MRVEVSHDNREIEYHDLLAQVNSILMLHTEADGITCEFGEMSCEMIAKEIRAHLRTFYNERATIVSVFEDGEAGAVVT